MLWRPREIAKRYRRRRQSLSRLAVREVEDQIFFNVAQLVEGPLDFLRRAKVLSSKASTLALGKYRTYSVTDPGNRMLAPRCRTAVPLAHNWARGLSVLF